MREVQCLTAVHFAASWDTEKTVGHGGGVNQWVKVTLAIFIA